ncbi:hypothetical protein OIU76_009338 [Salix suchowensis]|nr:hypothetical protein OIU76_009338 [Salix suchowensis]
MSRRSGTCLRLLDFLILKPLPVLLASVIALLLSLFSRLLLVLDFNFHLHIAATSHFIIEGGLANLSVTDCGGNDPDLKTEMEKQFVDLLTEELKLQEAVAQEYARHMNITLGEAKRVASQYQREAEKCNAATETCEEARERSEALLTRERKVTSLWEQRARQLGYEGE